MLLDADDRIGDHAIHRLQELLKGGLTEGIVCDVGMPLMHDSVRYNCRVFLLNGRILAIRPKQNLADDGNYRHACRKPGWGELWIILTAPRWSPLCSALPESVHVNCLRTHVHIV